LFTNYGPNPNDDVVVNVCSLSLSLARSFSSILCFYSRVLVFCTVVVNVCSLSLAVVVNVCSLSFPRFDFLLVSFLVWFLYSRVLVFCVGAVVAV